MTLVCGRSDFHPYECDHESCIHCNSVDVEGHEPYLCPLCLDGCGLMTEGYFNFIDTLLGDRTLRLAP